jgi:hypothetical protein
VNSYSNRSTFAYMSALTGLSVVLAVFSGNVIGAGDAYAQSQSCSCLLSAGTPGVIGSVHGNVFVTQKSGAVEGQPDMPLGAGASVIVGPRSTSVVHFGQKCMLQLTANTTLEVRPQGAQLCLSVNRQSTEARSATQPGNVIVPGLMLGGLAAGALAIGISNDRPASQ